MAKKLAPEVRRLDTLQHPLGCRNARNPGTLMVAQNDPAEWECYACEPDALLLQVELRSAKGLINLVASPRFVTGVWSPTQKRDLQRAVTAAVLAYNEMAANAGTPAITIHENHLLGDGAVHEPHQMVRRASERDYDYYHTLGVPHADNGRMLPHYHLEFGEPLNKCSVGLFFKCLREWSKVLEGQILSQETVKALQQKVPAKARPRTALPMQKRPQQLTSPQRRDELEGAFIALASQNTYNIELRCAPVQPFRRNMLMNKFRAAEPLVECFGSGHTAEEADLIWVEALPTEGCKTAAQVKRLLSAHHALLQVARNLVNDHSSDPEERQALVARLRAGADKVKSLLLEPKSLR